MPIRGRKNLRGQSELHSEIKVPVSIGLSQSALHQLDLISQSIKCSRSELVERIARGLVQLVWCESDLVDKSKRSIAPEEDVITIYHADLLRDSAAQPLKVWLIKESSKQTKKKSNGNHRNGPTGDVNFTRNKPRS